MDWGFLIWITLMFAGIMLIGLANDYSQSIERGWKPIVDFPKVWKRIKGWFKK